MGEQVAPTIGQALTDDSLVEGVVFMFTKDLAFLGDMWGRRRPGVHFIVGGPHGEYMFSAFNTARGKWDYLMAERWVMESTRIIAVIPKQAEPHCDSCGCE